MVGLNSVPNKRDISWTPVISAIMAGGEQIITHNTVISSPSFYHSAGEER